MKKIYALLIASVGLASIASAQCTITSGPTITPNGLQISATGTGTGAVYGVYGWDWGDATSPGVGQNATHTYASAGTYNVCMYYIDATDTSCHDTNCAQTTVSATGINDPANPNAVISTLPNPFANSMNISFALYKPDNVYVSIMDITGKEVAVLANGNMSAGDHVLTWDPANVQAGVYFLQIKSGSSVYTKKVIYTGGK